MVGVVEPTVSLAPEVGEDFQAVAAAVQANPMAVLLDSGCSHHLMGTKAVFMDMASSDGVKHVRGFNGALQLLRVAEPTLCKGKLGSGSSSPTYSTIDTIKNSAKHEVATGLDITLSTGTDPPCVSCVGGKLAWHTFPDKGSNAEEALAVVHIDLCGPFRVAAKDGSLYFLLLKDRHTRFVWVMLVAKKSDVLREFQNRRIHEDNAAAHGRAAPLVASRPTTSCVGAQLPRAVDYAAGDDSVSASDREEAQPLAGAGVGLHGAVHVDEPADEDVVEVLPPPPVLAPPFPVAYRPASAPLSATGNEGRLEASPVAPASGIAGGRQNAKLSTGEQQTGSSRGELSKSVEGKQLVDNLAIDEEGELSAGEESTDSDVVEVPITKPELRHTGRARRPPERLSFHACVLPTAFSTVYDDDPLYNDAEEDEKLPELDPNVQADPEHHRDIATMKVKEAMASWKGDAVKAAMEDEIRSLISMGTWELVERPRGVNIMKNRWVLTTKYRIDDTVGREKARPVVKGFTQVCGADYDETYSPVSSYVTLRIFLSIVAVLDLNLMQLVMKNAFLQSKLDRVLYMYQPDYFNDGTGRVCKMLKSLYWLKQTPLLWYRALGGVLQGASWKKSQVDEALYFKASNNGVTCWVLVYVDDLIAASSSPAMLKELKGLRFIDEEQSGRVPKTPVSVDAYAELTFDDEEAQERKEEEYRQKVDSLQFAATTTRPDIAFACSKLGSGLTCATLSSIESKYVAATDAGKEGRRLRFLLAEFKLLDAGKPTILRVDNKSAITVAESLGLTGNLKHMERRYAWLQHMVRCGKFVLKYIPTTEKPADFLTKALHFPAFNRCSVAIGQVRLADIGNGDDDAQQ
ncbi:unnamed protein product [Closterium sp. NIES-53]